MLPGNIVLGALGTKAVSGSVFCDRPRDFFFSVCRVAKLELASLSHQPLSSTFPAVLLDTVASTAFQPSNLAALFF